MNWKIEYVEDGHFVNVLISGDFDVDRVEELAESLFACAFWKPGTNVLLDHLDLDFGNTEVDTWKKLSELHVKNDAHFGACKIAFLMKSLPDYLRGRQYELLAKPKVSATVHIFQSRSEAVKWLSA